MMVLLEIWAAGAMDRVAVIRMGKILVGRHLWDMLDEAEVGKEVHGQVQVEEDSC